MKYSLKTLVAAVAILVSCCVQAQVEKAPLAVPSPERQKEIEALQQRRTEITRELRKLIDARAFDRAEQRAREGIVELKVENRFQDSLWMQLAEALLRNHKDAEALQVLTAIPRQNRSEINARIALILARNGREEESANMVAANDLEWYGKSASYLPATDSREGLIGHWLLAIVPQVNRSGKLFYYEEALRLFPEHPYITLQLAGTYGEEGRREEAKALYWKIMNSSTGKFREEARVSYEQLGGKDHLRGGKPPVTPPVGGGGNFPGMW